MVQVVPVADYTATACVSFPGITFLADVQADRFDGTKIDLGNIIHFDALHGSIENHIETVLD